MVTHPPLFWAKYNYAPVGSPKFYPYGYTFWFCYEMTHPRYFRPNIEPAPWGLIAESTVYACTGMCKDVYTRGAREARS